MTTTLTAPAPAGTASFGTPFAAILEDALAGGNSPKPSPKEKGAFTQKAKTAERNSSMNWGHALFGSLAVETTLHLTMYAYGETNSHAVILGCGDKESVSLGFKVMLNAGVRLIHVKGGNVSDVSHGMIPGLTIKIDRVGDMKKAVHTRKKDEDNIDLIFIGNDGRFIQLQVSVTTRSGVFWLNVQEIWAGQVARTTRPKAKQFDILTHPVGSFETFVVPLYARNAYPGANYLKTFEKIGPKLLDIAVEHGAVVPASECTLANWEPNWDIEPVKDYDVAVVNWFNAVVGLGVASLKDGRTVFMHFRSFIDGDGNPLVSRGSFPAPEPMSTLSLRFKQGEGGRLQATAVRIS